MGFPNAGKSTFFYLLTGAEVQRDLYPFTTIGKNEGKAELRDELLIRLSQAKKSKEIRNFKITVYDIAGIVEGAHKGEGLGNEFLGFIREADLLIIVLRGFTDEKVPSYLKEINPQKEKEIIISELIISDLERIERKLKEKNIPAELKEKLILAKEKLEKEEEPDEIPDFPLLMAKRKVYVINSDDKKGNYKLDVKNPYFICPFKILEEMRELDEDEREEIKEELKKEKFNFPEEILEYSFNLLGFIRFYTLKGEIASSFPLKKGKTAYDAAGKVHTDIQRGFIKVEVAKPFDFLEVPSWKELKEKGKIETHGPDYVVKDRDILEFKFSK